MKLTPDRNGSSEQPVHRGRCHRVAMCRSIRSVGGSSRSAGTSFSSGGWLAIMGSIGACKRASEPPKGFANVR